MIISDSIRDKIAPNGKLISSINFGNPLIAQKDSESGHAKGVSVHLSKALAKLLGVELKLITFDTARDSVAAVVKQEADIGFFAIDATRAEHISFTDPYALIQGWYLVNDNSLLKSFLEVDNEANRVVVGKGTAYDLYLSRHLKHAEIIRAYSSQDVVDLFMREKMEVAAGVRQQLEMDIQRYPGLRFLDHEFMTISQAIAISKSRGDEAASFMSSFINQMISEGHVRQGLVDSDVEDAVVVPSITA